MVYRMTLTNEQELYGPSSAVREVESLQAADREICQDHGPSLPRFCLFLVGDRGNIPNKDAATFGC